MWDISTLLPGEKDEMKAALLLRQCRAVNWHAVSFHDASYNHQFVSVLFFSTGRVLSQTTPGTPPKTVTISESGVIGTTLSSAIQQTPNKIAISPLKSPNKVKSLFRFTIILVLLWQWSEAVGYIPFKHISLIQKWWFINVESVS